MKRVPLIFAACACLAVFAGGSRVSARPRALHAISTAGKAASDQAMQTGLAALQAAAGDAQSGNAAQTGTDLQSAISAMSQAKPIYKGYREKSIHSADAALKLLRGTEKNAAKRVSNHIARAIQDAQSALAAN